MKSKIAILFAGLALLTAVPANAENALWQPSIEQTPVTQTTDFEVQEVRFRGGRFRRGGFRRGGFRRGGFRRGGFRRSRFRRGGFRTRRFRRGGFKKGGIKNSFGHRFGHRKVKSNVKFKPGIIYHDGFFKHHEGHFGRSQRLDQGRRFSQDPDSKSFDFVNESPQEPTPMLKQKETPSLTEANNTRPVQSAEIISGGSGDSSLFTEGVQEESAAEFLGVELKLVPGPKNE